MNVEHIHEMEGWREDFLRRAKDCFAQGDNYVKQADSLAIAITIAKSKAIAEDGVSIYLPKLSSKRFSLAKKESVADKAIKIIKGEGRFLYRREIIDLASKYNIIFIGDIKATLSYASQSEDNELTLQKPQGNIGVYGLKSWVTPEGNIQQDKLYIKNGDYERTAREYKLSFSWPEKVRYILRSEKKLLTANQILTHIVEDYEPSLNGGEEVLKNTKTILINALKTNLDKYFFRKQSIESTTEQPRYYYGLVAWQDDDGNYDEKYIPDNIEFE